MKNDFKTELKLKKEFPFFYFHNRPKTQIEIINDNYQLASDLYFVMIPIVVVTKIYFWLKRKIKGELNEIPKKPLRA